MRGQPQRGLVQRNQTCSHLDPGFLSSRIMTEKSLFKPQKEGPDQELNQPSSTDAPAPTVLNPPPRGLHSQQDSKHRPGVQQNVCAEQYFRCCKPHRWQKGSLKSTMESNQTHLDFQSRVIHNTHHQNGCCVRRFSTTVLCRSPF